MKTKDQVMFEQFAKLDREHELRLAELRKNRAMKLRENLVKTIDYLVKELELWRRLNNQDKINKIENKIAVFKQDLETSF